MDKVLTNAQMRAADAYTINIKGVSSAELMRRAGVAIAEEVEKLAKTDVLVVCGTGNNGGDGYVCAEELRKRGLAVKVYACDGKLSPDCEREKNSYKGGYSRDIRGAIIVDCLFGTGLSREITGEFKEITEKINSSEAYVVSADIPSGLNGDNGQIMGCAVKADATIAVAEYKAGMFLGDGIDLCGKIIKKDIGITCPENDYAFLNCPQYMRGFYPKRRRNSHKGTYGSVNLVVGSDKYIGAAALATEGALKSGCGYVKVTTTEKVINCLAPKFPQAIYCNEVLYNSEALAVGSGCGATEELYGTVKNILSNYYGKLLIDADGLNALAKFGVQILKEKNCEVLITPHVKEFSGLTRKSVDEILSDPIAVAKSFAEEFGVTVLLKGAASIVTDGKKTVLNTTGTTALSKGGSGDILTGFACGTMARGLSSFDAAVCAAYTLGLAAEIASEEKTDYCATAKDIIKNLHYSVKRLTD